MTGGCDAEVIFAETGAERVEGLHMVPKIFGAATMGVFVGERLGLSNLALAMSAITSFFTFFVLMNGLKQALFKKRNEPPVVFHWLPFVGSALSYGQEPNKF